MNMKKLILSFWMATVSAALAQTAAPNINSVGATPGQVLTVGNNGPVWAAPAVSGDTLWGTNATSGKVTNILGGVSVGANSLNVSNGTASFINLLNSPATPRWMVGGNQGAFTTGTTNSITGTNGSGFFVLDTSGNQTNSGSVVVTNAGGASRQVTITGSSIDLKLNSDLFVNGTAGDATKAIRITAADGASAQIRMGRNKIGWGNNYASEDTTLNSVGTSNLNLIGAFTVTQSVTATNGYFLPQLSGIPSVDIRSSSGNTNWFSFNLGGEPIYLKTNAAAASSYITNYPMGAYVSSNVALGFGPQLTTGVPTNIARVALTPGTWVLSGGVVFSHAASTVSSQLSASFSYQDNLGVSDGFEQYVTPGTGITTGVTCPNKVFNVTSNTTLYIIGHAIFTTSTMQAYGSITATRIY